MKQHTSLGTMVHGRGKGRERGMEGEREGVRSLKCEMEPCVDWELSDRVFASSADQALL